MRKEPTIVLLMVAFFFIGLSFGMWWHEQDPPEVVICVPVVPATDNDPDGVKFEIWADDAVDLDYQPLRSGGGVWKNELNHTLGFSKAEDDWIFEDRRCI